MKINSPAFSPLFGRFRRLLLAAALGAAGVGSASANPHGHTVIDGTVTFSRQGNVFSITNTPNAIIEWKSFSIKAGQITQFIQQSSSSSVLNRITGEDPSQIFGSLISNGHVFLVNPNGVFFGQGSQINVAGLVASSLAISNGDFQAGKNYFNAGNVAGNVTNNGNITTPSGGQVFLIAPDVTNNGIITSPQGEVLLVAGHSVELADSTNPSMHVVVSSPADQAINLGQVIAQGGRIGIYGSLVNQRGTLNANSAVVGENGQIILRASGMTLLEAGSTTTATGIDSGGEIQVLGQQVGMTGNASVDASGQNGGGTVLIGGDYQGKNPAVMDAQQTYVGQDASIKADAITQGNGGKVIVWGEQTTQAHGSISVQGGAQSGDGGFVETSGGFLDIANIRVNATAQHGQLGKWLLDPANIIISSGDDTSNLDNSATFAANAGMMSFINPSQFTNIGANVTLQATQDITFDSAVTFLTANVGLTAQAGNNINVNASITTNNGAVRLSANDNGGGTASGNATSSVGGQVIFSNNATVTGGNINISGFVPAPATCAANPALQGCVATVTPTVSVCAANPSAAGCAAVLAPVTSPSPQAPLSVALNQTVQLINNSSSLITSGGNAAGALLGPPTPPSASTPVAPQSTPSLGVAANATAKKMYCN